VHTRRLVPGLRYVFHVLLQLLFDRQIGIEEVERLLREVSQLQARGQFHVPVSAEIRLYTVSADPGRDIAKKKIGRSMPVDAVSRRNAGASLTARSTASRLRIGTIRMPVRMFGLIRGVVDPGAGVRPPTFDGNIKEDVWL